MLKVFEGRPGRTFVMWIHHLFFPRLCVIEPAPSFLSGHGTDLSRLQMAWEGEPVCSPSPEVISQCVVRQLGLFTGGKVMDFLVQL